MQQVAVFFTICGLYIGLSASMAYLVAAYDPRRPPSKGGEDAVSFVSREERVWSHFDVYVSVITRRSDISRSVRTLRDVAFLNLTLCDAVWFLSSRLIMSKVPCHYAARSQSYQPNPRQLGRLKII
jgi:hypothetical protein